MRPVVHYHPFNSTATVPLEASPKKYLFRFPFLWFAYTRRLKHRAMCSALYKRNTRRTASCSANVELSSPITTFSPDLASTIVLDQLPTCSHTDQEHADPARPGVVRPLELLPAALLAFLHDVSVTHAVPRDVPQPVDRVEVVVLADARRQVVQGVHDVAGPWWS